MSSDTLQKDQFFGSRQKLQWRHGNLRFKKPLTKVEAAGSTNTNLKVESRGEDATFIAFIAFIAHQQSRRSSWIHDPVV
jgi:hypothetical protein